MAHSGSHLCTLHVWNVLLSRGDLALLKANVFRQKSRFSDTDHQFDTTHTYDTRAAPTHITHTLHTLTCLAPGAPRRPPRLAGSGCRASPPAACQARLHMARKVVHTLTHVLGCTRQHVPHSTPTFACFEAACSSPARNWRD